jgi:hypothetical protein
MRRAAVNDPRLHLTLRDSDQDRFDFSPLVRSLAFTKPRLIGDGTCSTPEFTGQERKKL